MNTGDIVTVREDASTMYGGQQAMIIRKARADGRGGSNVTHGTYAKGLSYWLRFADGFEGYFSESELDLSEPAS